jgi:hypothetical protein
MDHVWVFGDRCSRSSHASVNLYSNVLVNEKSYSMQERMYIFTYIDVLASISCIQQTYKLNTYTQVDAHASMYVLHMYTVYTFTQVDTPMSPPSG